MYVCRYVCIYTHIRSITVNTKVLQYKGCSCSNNFSWYLWGVWHDKNDLVMKILCNKLIFYNINC